MKKFLEEIQSKAAGALVSGLTIGLTWLIYKIVPQATRQAILQKSNDLLDVIPPTAYLLLLIIVLVPTCWYVWKLRKRNWILITRLKRIHEQRKQMTGPARMVDVGDKDILFRVSYPQHIDIRLHTEQVHVRPFCKIHNMHLVELGGTSATFWGKFECHACNKPYQFDNDKMRQLMATAVSKFVKSWEPPVYEEVVDSFIDN